MAKVDPRLDPTLSRAATIADERAHAHSKSRCWHYVKEALLASGAVLLSKSSLAKEAGEELVRDYGFKKLPIRDPYAAPVGSVLVYFKGNRRPGHVEIRTKTGFVSDFRSKARASPRSSVSTPRSRPFFEARRCASPAFGQPRRYAPRQIFPVRRSGQIECGTDGNNASGINSASWVM